MTVFCHQKIEYASVYTGAFYKLDEIGNNVNIGIRGFTAWKQKIPVTKCYPQWVLNPGL